VFSAQCNTESASAAPRPYSHPYNEYEEIAFLRKEYYLFFVYLLVVCVLVFLYITI
jgi:hypothetical protein